MYLTNNLAVFSAVFAIFGTISHAHEASTTHATLYGGMALDNGIHQIGWPPDWRTYPQSRVAGMGVGHELTRVANNLMGIELEGTALRHWGKQLAWDTSVAGTARWHNVPWQTVMPGSVAFSAGISRFSRISSIEQERIQHQAKTIGYLAAELTGFASTSTPWEGVARWHHRSGGYGTFNNVTGGSNYFLFGIRRHF